MRDVIISSYSLLLSLPQLSSLTFVVIISGLALGRDLPTLTPLYGVCCVVC